MAHETYIGVNNIAQNVNKIWVGDNGVAKKVKRGYIGDANGIARLFFFSGYVWNRYEAIQQTYYYVTNTTDYTSVTGVGNVRRVTLGKYAYGSYIPMYTRYNIDSNNGEITLLNQVNIYFDADLDNNYYAAGCPRNFYDYENRAFYGSGANNQCHLEYQHIKGDYYIDFKGFPYYMKPTIGYKYVQGSYIGQVESDNPSAYPDNGRGSDGYWYVKVET